MTWATVKKWVKIEVKAYLLGLLTRLIEKMSRKSEE